MPGLYLHCSLCGRKRADGLLSRAAWGHLQLSDGTNASACPNCREEHSDWEQRVRVAAVTMPDSGAAFGGAYPER
jgi:hypothetical protein